MAKVPRVDEQTYAVRLVLKDGSVQILGGQWNEWQAISIASLTRRDRRDVVEARIIDLVPHTKEAR